MNNTAEYISGILDEVAQRDGIKGLRLSPQGTAALRLSKGREIFFEYVKDAALLCLYTPILPIPNDATRKLALYEAMLTCNFLKLHTGNGELAIIPDMQQVAYQHILDVHTLTADILDRFIDELLDQSQACIHILQLEKPIASDKSRTAHRLQLMMKRPV